MSQAVKENRIGCFKVDAEEIRKFNRKELNSLFGGMLIVRAEEVPVEGTIHYAAYSMLFEPAPKHCGPKWYSLHGQKIVDSEGEQVLSISARPHPKKHHVFGTWE
jgi:hypothetical protein